MPLKMHRMHWIVALGAVWWFIFSITTGLLLEDALITYRHAANLAAGNGFVFNPGEWVLGSTSPGQGLPLALIGMVAGAGMIPTVGTILMTCAGVATGYVLYRLLQTAGCTPLTCALTTALFYGFPRIMVTSVGGMETPLVLLFMLLSLLSLLRKRYTLAACQLAILVLLRPDGAIWAAIVGMAIALQRRTIPWRQAAVALLILSPWVLYASLTYGSPIPHTVTAKHAIGQSSTFMPRLSAIALRDFATWYAGATGFDPNRLVLALTGLGAMSMMARPRTRLPGIILSLFVVLYGATLYCGRAPYFTWYLTPVALCCVVFYTIGAVQLGDWITHGVSRLGTQLNVTPLVAILLVLAPCVAMNAGVLQKYTEEQANEIQTRRAVGEWLREHTPPDASVASEAIGYLGFYSQRRVIDMAGLVSPAVVSVAKRSATNAALFWNIITELKPDLIVLRSYEVDRNQHFHGGPLFEGPLQATSFHERYAEAARFTAPFPARWHEQAFLTLYQRRALPGTPALHP